MPAQVARFEREAAGKLLPGSMGEAEACGYRPGEDEENLPEFAEAGPFLPQEQRHAQSQTGLEQDGQDGPEHIKDENPIGGEVAQYRLVGNQPGVMDLGGHVWESEWRWMDLSGQPAPDLPPQTASKTIPDGCGVEIGQGDTDLKDQLEAGQQGKGDQPGNEPGEGAATVPDVLGLFLRPLRFCPT